MSLCGVKGIFGDNCAVLFFILVFLLLFATPGYGVAGVAGVPIRD